MPAPPPPSPPSSRRRLLVLREDDFKTYARAISRANLEAFIRANDDEEDTATTTTTTTTTNGEREFFFERSYKEEVQKRVLSSFSSSSSSSSDESSFPTNAFKDVCVEQFLHRAKEYVLETALKELSETLRDIEKEEGEERSLRAVIANVLDGENEDDTDGEDEGDNEKEESKGKPSHTCLRAFSRFARKVEKLKAIASEVAEMVLVGGEDEDGGVDGMSDKENASVMTTMITTTNKNHSSRSPLLLPLDAQSQKKKFEKKFDNLIAELIVSCGPRNATRVLSAYYAKIIAKFRDKCAFPLDEEEFYATAEEQKTSRRDGGATTLNTKTKTDENEKESMQLSDDDDDDDGDGDEDEENEVEQYRNFVKNVRKHLRNCASPTKMLGKLECARIERVHKDSILKYFKIYSYEAFEIASDFAIKHFALKFAASNFKASALKCVALYSRVVPLQIAKTVFGFESVQFGNETPSQFHRKFISSSKEHLGALRIEELFDIVVDYPDSLGAVKDLRMCLSDDRQYGLQESLVSSFTEQLRRRLLHPGARTADVISQYIGTIKTLRDLDPSGIVLDLVSGPIRKYLRKRKDTIRCVVTMLTDDGSGDRNDNEQQQHDGDGGGGDASTANALFAELSAMAREELKNENAAAATAAADVDHNHDRRRREGVRGGIADKDDNESESSELDEDDGDNFNAFKNKNRNEDYRMGEAEEGPNNRDGNSSDESESEGDDDCNDPSTPNKDTNNFKKSTSLLKSQNSGMEAIMDYESKQLSRTLTSFGVDQLQNLVLDRTESGLTWGKNFGTPVPVDIFSREQSRRARQQQQQEEQRHRNLQKAGELESLIPGRKNASAPRKILKRFPGDAWDPEPVVSEATKLRSRKRHQLRDIIGLLIGIYGGKELFVNEYRLMLADKLLQKSNYDAERETLALELLKNKFGETHLHDCEVMLRDVNDSRRVNANVKTRPAEGTPLAKKGLQTTEMLKESPVQALILSRLFWPKDIAKSAATIVAPPSSSSSAAATHAGLPHSVSAPSRQEQETMQMNTNDDNDDGLNDPSAANTSPTSPPPEGDAPVFDEDNDAQQQQRQQEQQQQEEDGDGISPILSRSLSSSPMKSTTVPPPSYARNDIILPPAIDQAMRAYEERYHELKAPRKMTWMRSLGRVVVEVSLMNEKPYDIVVSPLHAAILYHFTEREKWTAAELAKVLNATTKAVRQRMVLWMNRGVVSETSEATYELNTTSSASTKMKNHATGSLKTTMATDGGCGGTEDNDDDDLLHRAESSAEEIEAAEMKVYEQYVMGMLTNFPSMPIERIHNMLKMFVVEPAYDKTQAQLEKFLMSLVRAEKLTHDGENFSKRKE